MKKKYQSGETNSREYWAWGHMIQRCTNPKDQQWHNYGGRGIRVCDRWRWSYAAFLEDVGRAPEQPGERGGKLTLDRIDNDEGYYPGNCRWATAKAQAENKRPHPCRKLSPVDVAAIKTAFIGGATQSKLAEDYGVTQSVISRKVNGVVRRTR